MAMRKHRSYHELKEDMNWEMKVIRSLDASCT